MSAEDWNKDALVQAWLHMSKDRGDIYRQFLVNPIIVGLLQKHAVTSELSVYGALAQWLTDYKDCTSEKLAEGEWYQDWERREVGSLSILDLGCGDAYRGRWLSKENVAYVGVDVSQGLLNSDLNKGHLNGKHFTLVERDLNQINPLKNVWKERAPPTWIFAITIFDHLTCPERLLADVAKMYGLGQRGKMLVVTCNPSFYGVACAGTQPTKVKIATINDSSGEVSVYLRSQLEMRRLFRDAGFHVIDEASPHLPSQFAHLREFESSGYNLAHAPLNFWLLDIHSTVRYGVSAENLVTWSEELKKPLGHLEATRLLLDDLVKLEKTSELAWRRFLSGDVVLKAHNLGGKIFVVKSGSFEFVDGRGGASLDKAVALKPLWQFHPGEIFGELELPDSHRDHEWLYSSSIRVKDLGPSAYAEVLEIPCAVTRHLVHSDKLLGNPFLTLLRRKVLEGLVRFDQSLLEEKLRAKQGWNSKAPALNTPDFSKLEGRFVVIVAVLLVQGLEAERQQSGADNAHQNVVVISAIKRVIYEIIGGKNYGKFDASRFNRAIMFLAKTGVLRSARPSISQTVKSHSKQIPSQQQYIQSQIDASKKLKEHVNKQEWIQELDSEKKLIIQKLMRCQADCFFVINDEIMLRKLVFEPTVSLIDGLANRMAIYSNQVEDIDLARDNDIVITIVAALQKRLQGNRWQVDSLGWSLVDS